MIVRPAEREDHEKPGVEVRDLQLVGASPNQSASVGMAANSSAGRSEPPNGMTAKTRSTGRERDPRRDRVGEPVVRIRLPVLLEQHLHAVGQAVEQTPPDELDLRERDAQVRAVGADAGRT
jgi:hypothetical protein